MIYMAEMTRENAKRIEHNFIELDDCINFLLEYKNRGESVVVNYDGYDLYSCDVTIDNAYLEITGKTKEEFDKNVAEEKALYEKFKEEEKLRHKNAVEEWIKRGERLIYPEKLTEWKEYVEDNVNAGRAYFVLKDAIEVMESIERNVSLEESEKILHNRGHSGFTYGEVVNVVFNFSKKGPEFYEKSAYYEYMSKDIKKLVEEKKKENQQLAELHKTDLINNNTQRKQEELEISQKLEEKIQLTQEVDAIEKKQKELDDKEKEIKHNLSDEKSELKRNERE